MTKSNDVLKIKIIWQSIKNMPYNRKAWSNLYTFYVQRDWRWHIDYVAEQLVRFEVPLPISQKAAINKSRRKKTLQFWARSADWVLGQSASTLLTEAKIFIQSCLDSEGPDWLSLLYLSRIAYINGNDDEGKAFQTKAMFLEPVEGETQYYLAKWALSAGDPAEAVAQLSDLVDDPITRFGSMLILGEALFRLGNRPAAEQAFTRAARSQNPAFLDHLATRVFALNYWQEAVLLRKQIVAMRPRDAYSWLKLAEIQAVVFDSNGALQSCENALAIDPLFDDALLLESKLKADLGDVDSYFLAIKSIFDKNQDPTSRLASTLAMTSLYSANMSAKNVSDLHRRLCEPIESSVKQLPAMKSSQKLKDGRIHIAYLTGDLHRQHPVNLFMLPVLKRHTRSEFKISVFHTGSMYDEYTEQARQSVDDWYECGNWMDEDIAQRVRKENVDLLVDLAGHTSSHRLGVMAYHPARVQATFLGYPFSTGMSRIDYLIGDSIVTPDSDADLYSERLMNLPGSVFCWAPIDYYPVVTRTPLKGRPIVFGSFNNSLKLSKKTIELWSMVLAEVPDSRLILKAPSFTDSRITIHFLDLFVSHGISSNRIEFRGPSELNQMMQDYSEIDIALDPVPYNGGTTTLQALWMGTPVVVLKGNSFVSRMGASFLTFLGRKEWVADNSKDYIRIASSLATEVETLCLIHETLRSEMLGSPIGSIQNYVSSLEVLYLEMLRQQKSA